MRDFLFGLINQQTQAGAVRGLLRKAKLFSSITASANHLPLHPRKHADLQYVQDHMSAPPDGCVWLASLSPPI